MMSEFEEVLQDVGSFGPAQIRIFLLVSFFETPAAWSMFFPVFAFGTPPWECIFTTNHTEDESKQVASFSYFPRNRTLGVRIDMPTDSTTVQNMTAQCDIFAAGQCEYIHYGVTGTSIVSEWDLICHNSYVVTMGIKLAQMVGLLIGAFAAGQLADMYGRRKLLYLSYALMLGTGFASSFANSWLLYAVLRFLVGAFLGGTMVVNFVLPLECVGRQWRTFCGCVGFWAVGGMTLPLLAYFLPQWRHLSMAVSAGGVLLLLTWWWVPESPRWLLTQGRCVEAKAILRDWALTNKRPVPDFTSLHGISKKEERRRAESSRYTYWDLCRSVSMTRNTIIVLYAWFVSTLVYYGLTWSLGSLLTGTSSYITFTISCSLEIPPLFFVVMVNNKLGRRKTLFSLYGLAGILCVSVLFTAFSADGVKTTTFTLILLGRACIAGGWAATQVYSGETFPTVVRNIGIGACAMAARIGGIVGTPLSELAVFWGPLPYVLVGCLCIVCAIACWFLPETLNCPLPDAVPARTICKCLTRHTCWHGNKQGKTDNVLQIEMRNGDVTETLYTVPKQLSIECNTHACDEEISEVMEKDDQDAGCQSELIGNHDDSVSKHSVSSYTVPKQLSIECNTHALDEDISEVMEKEDQDAGCQSELIGNHDDSISNHSDSSESSSLEVDFSAPEKVVA